MEDFIVAYRLGEDRKHFEHSSLESFTLHDPHKKKLFNRNSKLSSSNTIQKLSFSLEKYLSYKQKETICFCFLLLVRITVMPPIE